MNDAFELREPIQRPVRSGSFTIRTSPAEDAQLAGLVKAIGVSSRADVMRTTLRYFLSHHPVGQAVLASIDTTTSPEPETEPPVKAKPRSRTKSKPKAKAKATRKSRRRQSS